MSALNNPIVKKAKQLLRDGKLKELYNLMQNCSASDQMLIETAIYL